MARRGEGSEEQQVDTDPTGRADTSEMGPAVVQDELGPQPVGTAERGGKLLKCRYPIGAFTTGDRKYTVTDRAARYPADAVDTIKAEAAKAGVVVLEVEEK